MSAKMDQDTINSLACRNMAVERRIMNAIRGERVRMAGLAYRVTKLALVHLDNGRPDLAASQLRSLKHDLEEIGATLPGRY